MTASILVTREVVEEGADVVLWRWFSTEDVPVVGGSFWLAEGGRGVPVISVQIDAHGGQVDLAPLVVESQRSQQTLRSMYYTGWRSMPLSSHPHDAPRVPADTELVEVRVDWYQSYYAPCDRCSAQIGQRCTSVASGRTVETEYPHLVRVDAASRYRVSGLRARAR